MGSEEYDDSSGKHRRQDSKTRSGLLISALLAGVCLGVIFSEQLYIHYQNTNQSSDAGPLGGTASGGNAARKLGQASATGSANVIMRSASKLRQSQHADNVAQQLLLISAHFATIVMFATC